MANGFTLKNVRFLTENSIMTKNIDYFGFYRLDGFECVLDYKFKVR